MLLDPQELGREGLRVKESNIAARKTEQRSTLFKLGVGASLLAVAVSGLGLTGYHIYKDYHAPASVAARQLSSEVARQERAARQQENAALKEQEAARLQADQAIKQAKEEAAAALVAQQEAGQAARPGIMLDKVMNATQMGEAVCAPYHIELRAKFNAHNEITEMDTSFKYSISSHDNAAARTKVREAVADCKTDFSVETFIAARGLGPLTTRAHYSQLKDMWSLCRNGYTEPAMKFNEYRDGSGDLYYQLYPKAYSFGGVEAYKAYQDCMVKALDHPLIKTGGGAMAHLSAQPG